MCKFIPWGVFSLPRTPEEGYAPDLLSQISG